MKALESEPSCLTSVLSAVPPATLWHFIYQFLRELQLLYCVKMDLGEVTSCMNSESSEHLEERDQPEW